MSGFLDTDILMRYFTRNPPLMADRARALLERGEDLIVTDGVIAEVLFVLRRVYGVPLQYAVDAVINLIARDNIRVWGLEQGLAIEALELSSAFWSNFSP